MLMGVGYVTVSVMPVVNGLRVTDLAEATRTGFFTGVQPHTGHPEEPPRWSWSHEVHLIRPVQVYSRISVRHRYPDCKIILVGRIQVFLHITREVQEFWGSQLGNWEVEFSRSATYAVGFGWGGRPPMQWF